MSQDGRRAALVARRALYIVPMHTECRAVASGIARPSGAFSRSSIRPSQFLQRESAHGMADLAIRRLAVRGPTAASGRETPCSAPTTLAGIFADHATSEIISEPTNPTGSHRAEDGQLPATQRAPSQQVGAIGSANPVRSAHAHHRANALRNTEEKAKYNENSRHFG